MPDFDPQEYGSLKTDVKYLIDCCQEMKERSQKIIEEQMASKTRLIATLVGVIITLAFLVLTYARTTAK